MSGYDLSIIDQAVWKYSQLKDPITTTHVFFDKPIYIDHLELIFVLLAPLYWIFNSVVTLIVLQTVAIVASGLAIFLISKKYRLNRLVSLAILISYLSFFGFQFSIWSDVHSLLFAVCFLAWFIYFLESKKTKLSILFFILAIITKEDIALLTLLISATYAIVARSKLAWLFSGFSILYLLVLFQIYFPTVLPEGYRFASETGLTGDLNPQYLFNTADKQKTFLYSFGWFGFLPILAPLHLIPFLGDLAHYFVVGNGITRTEGIFLHYRSTTALLLVWPTIIAISKFKKVNMWYTGVYLLLCCAFLQYYLHLPLSYLSKSWFWTIPLGTADIKKGLDRLPANASVASQINILPHISHRDEVYSLLPDSKDFDKNSPCEQKNCKWFRIGKTPEYILVDTSPSWDERHFLTTREEFIERLKIMEKAGVIKVEFNSGNTTLYKVVGKL